MRHLIGKILIIVFMFTTVFATISYAQDEGWQGPFTIYGWVYKAGTSDPISDVSVTADFIPPQSTYTDVNGRYEFNYHNFCDAKKLTYVKAGYETVRKYVSDGSCPECTGDDDDTCKTGKMVNIALTYENNQDIDADGILNANDNCPNDPNGWLLGTCTTGRRGMPCNVNRECGCGGYCSKSQEDCDGNGIGDACDYCVEHPPGCFNCNETMALSSMPAHKLAREFNKKDRTQLWIMAALFFNMNNSHTYNNWIEFIRGIFNGPDFINCRGKQIPTHDFNDNGIPDEEEDGIPVWVTQEDYLEGYLDAVQECLEQHEE